MSKLTLSFSMALKWFFVAFQYKLTREKREYPSFCPFFFMVAAAKNLTKHDRSVFGGDDNVKEQSWREQ